MGLTAIASRKSWGNYNICDYGDKTKSLVTILCLTNDKNFEKNRKTIIRKAIGIPTLKDPIESLTLLLQEGLLSRKKWRDFSEVKVEVTKNLAKDLLEGKLSAYQVTGKMKEVNPTLSSKDMTELWTKLSIVVGLEKLGDNALDINWDKEIEQKSLNPRILNLKASIHDKNQNNSIISKTYRENYPHLKSSKDGNINWAEIICNLSPQVAGLAKHLLNSSKTQILKKEATEETLFPRQSNHEIENRRLSTLISTVGNFHNNREKRYQRIIFNLEDYKKIPQLPKMGVPTPSEDEIKRAKRIIHEVRKKLEEHKFTATPEKLVSMVKGPEMFNLKKSLLRLRKINYPEAQDAYKKWEGIIKESEKELGHRKLTNLLDKEKDIPQKLILEKILSLTEEPQEFKEDYLLAYLKHLEPTKENIEFLKTNAIKSGLESKSLKNYLERDIVDKPPVETWGRGILLVESLKNNREFSPKLPVGKAKRTPLQIASLLGMPEEVESIAEAIKGSKSALNPTLEDGRTPLFSSNPDVTRVLLKYGADFNAKDPRGHKADTCNPHKESRSIIKEYRAKVKVRELIKQENDGLDAYLP